MRFVKSSNQRRLSFKSKFYFFLTLVFLVLVGLSFFSVWNRNRQVNREISGLRSEISNLEKDNVELGGLIEYFNSSAYIEEKARNDLGLRKEGERVVVVSDSLNLHADTGAAAVSGQTEQPLSNPQKWWRHFFQ